MLAGGGRSCCEAGARAAARHAAVVKSWLSGLAWILWGLKSYTVLIFYTECTLRSHFLATRAIRNKRGQDISPGSRASGLQQPQPRSGACHTRPQSQGSAPLLLQQEAATRSYDEAATACLPGPCPFSHVALCSTSQSPHHSITPSSALLDGTLALYVAPNTVSAAQYACTPCAHPPVNLLP